MLLEHLLAGLRVRARARDHLRAPGLHHDAPVRLLLVRHLHHVDLALQAEHLAGERERRAPLSSTRFGAEPGDLFLLVVVRLRDGRVRLVAAGRAHALVLVVDVRRRAEGLLEAARAIERRRPPQPIDVTDLVRDLDPALLADLLLDQLHRKQRRQILRPDRVLRPGVEHRRRRRLEVGLDVVPLRRDVLLVEQELRAIPIVRLGCHADLLRRDPRETCANHTEPGASLSMRRPCGKLLRPCQPSSSFRAATGCSRRTRSPAARRSRRRPGPSRAGSAWRPSTSSPIRWPRSIRRSRWRSTGTRPCATGTTSGRSVSPSPKRWTPRSGAWVSTGAPRRS